MARRATLTSAAHLPISAERLAKLVVHEVGPNSTFEKIVTVALPGARGPDAIAGVVDRRLAGL